MKSLRSCFPKLFLPDGGDAEPLANFEPFVTPLILSDVFAFFLDEPNGKNLPRKDIVVNCWC